MRSNAAVRTVVGAAALGIGMAAATQSHAASATANLAVSASVVNNCVISTTALAFGDYDPVDVNASADLDASGTVTVACTKNVAPTIGLGLGSNASGTTRRLTDGSGNYLTYQLFRDAGRTAVWGDAAPDLLAPAAAPSKAPRNFTVYGRVTGNQDVPAGDYDDTIVATVNF